MVGLERLESNNVIAYIETGLYEQISQRGHIYVDFIIEPQGNKGFTISVKKTPDEKTECC